MVGKEVFFWSNSYWYYVITDDVRHTMTTCRKANSFTYATRANAEQVARNDMIGLVEGILPYAERELRQIT